MKIKCKIIPFHKIWGEKRYLSVRGERSNKNKDTRDSKFKQTIKDVYGNKKLHTEILVPLFTSIRTLKPKVLLPMPKT